MASTSESPGGETTLEPHSWEGDGADPHLLDAESETRPTLSVVLPTLNEEQGVGDCIRKIRRTVDRLGVSAEIVVSDSSTDRTPEIAREMGARVVEPDRRGYGCAYRYAFERARGEYVAMGDADGTYDFEELPKLFELVESGRADVAMGSRLDGEILPGSMPKLHQYVGNPLLTAFLNVFYGAGVSDAHSGFRVFRRDVLSALDLQSNGMEFASEMIMKAAEAGFRIEEVPITYHERVGEATLDSFRDGWRHVKFMLLNAPSSLFVVPALACGSVGILLALLSLAGVQAGGLTFGTHTTIVASLLLIVGYQIGVLGTVSAIGANPIKPHSGRITDWVQDGFRLEHGATAGVALFGVGALSAGGMTFEWLAGQVETPFVVPSLLAFTAIVLGVQTLFNSFCLSILINGGYDRE